MRKRRDRNRRRPAIVFVLITRGAAALPPLWLIRESGLQSSESNLILSPLFGHFLISALPARSLPSRWSHGPRARSRNNEASPSGRKGILACCSPARYRGAKKQQRLCFDYHRSSPMSLLRLCLTRPAVLDPVVVQRPGVKTPLEGKPSQ